ncbi:hypothetical protein MTR67_019094 [Solanum verrucosum]|uniref:Uncharacterized protein n=1 Tax=Solanum verrucosum TaxID=315347 RepID=A0AAF0QKW1_SOLVR|nr:hypothetical protein MTR67_019094 [Solanum verrucosum]
MWPSTNIQNRPWVTLRSVGGNRGLHLQLLEICWFGLFSDTECYTYDFHDLEKIYDKVAREVLWICPEERGELVTYIWEIKDMYEGDKTWIRMVGGDFEQFLVDMELHQGSTPSLFVLVMDKSTVGSPKVTDPEVAEGQGRRVMELTKGRIASGSVNLGIAVANVIPPLCSWLARERVVLELRYLIDGQWVLGWPGFSSRE